MDLSVLLTYKIDDVIWSELGPSYRRNYIIQKLLRHPWIANSGTRRALTVMWLLGLVSSYTLGGFIHLFLVVALMVGILQLLRGRRLPRGS